MVNWCAVSRRLPKLCIAFKAYTALTLRVEHEMESVTSYELEIVVSCLYG